MKRLDLLARPVKPQEAMPGRVLGPGTLDRQRKAAALVLARRLDEAKVPVR